MKLLFDFFPVLLFFLTFKSDDEPQEGILAATAVIIVATCVQVAVTWWRHRRVEKVFFWVLAVAFLGSHFIGHKTLVQRFFDAKFEPPAKVWGVLNALWIVFFLAVGALNLFVVYNFSTDTWVNFKLFGLTGLMFVFVFAQMIYLFRYMIPDEEDAEEQG